MYSYDKVLSAIIKFIETELEPKMQGIQKWMFGTMAGIVAKKSEEVYKELSNNKMLKSLNIIKDNDINFDLIYEELIKQAEKGPIDINIPMIGIITLNSSDVKKLHQILEGGY